MQIIYYKGFGNKWILNIKNNENVIVLLNDQETLIFPTQILVHKANFKVAKTSVCVSIGQSNSATTILITKIAACIA